MEKTKKEQFLEARTRGLTRRQSAVVAGIAGDGSSTDQLPSVQAELARVRQQMAVDSGVTRQTIIDGLLDAAAQAKLMGEPATMVAAWRELGKMLGFYAPEVRKIEKGINKRDLKNALEDMSDDELRQLARGRVIDGEFKRIGGPEAAEDVPVVQKD